MPSVYLIGDSTMAQDNPPAKGWGWAFHRYVREGVAVHNHAASGRSSLSFRREGRFDPVAEGLTAGDLLVIQFGHNDEKDDDRHTDPETTFTEELRRCCWAALDRGALPVLLTPVSRRFFVGTCSLMYTHGEYPGAMRRLAAEKGVPLCDLSADSRALYMRLGEEKTAELFVRLAPGEHPDFPDGHDDKTHFNAYGAQEICKLVVSELKRHPQCAAYLK